MPFNSQLLKLLEESNDFENYGRSPAERKILVDCLTFVPKLGSKIVEDWINKIELENESNEADSIQNEPLDIKVYFKAHLENMPKLEGFEKLGVKSVLKDKPVYEFTQHRPIEKEKLINLAANDKAKEEIHANSYCPNFLRPVPEVDQYLEDSIVEDAIWLFPGVLPEPFWEYTLGNNSSRVKTLMRKSLSGQLKKSNIDLIYSVMKNDPEAVLHYGIHSDDLGDLVIQNKDLAMEFLNNMASYPIITNYYMALSDTKVNLNSMELFNKLVQNHDLPKEYILYYIHNCFKSCKDEGTKNYKNRLVRLVSFVISFFLKNKVIPIEEIVNLKAESFFEENIDVKEASQILKQIKSFTNKGSE